MYTITKKKNSKGGKARRRWRDRLYDPRVIGVIAILCMIPILQNLLQRTGLDYTQLPQYQVDRDSIQLIELPEYMPPDLLQRTWDRSGLGRQFSLLTPGLAEKLGQAFEASPWVRRVKRIQLSYPNQLKIQLEYREPVALVAIEGGYYPVDRDGVLLPPMDFSLNDTEKYPLIAGVQSVPRGAAGDHWGDLSVWGAARLAEMFLKPSESSTLWERYHFEKINVEGRADLHVQSLDELLQIQLRLVTVEGSEVIWGVAPDVHDPSEPNAETKLKRLEMYLRDFGGLQTAQGPVEIDLRRWKDIARRPLPQPVHTLR